MPDTALAPRLIPLRCRSNGMEMALDSALEIGVGGEARVLGLRWDPTLVAKLYHRPTLEHARKLVLMIETPPTLPEGVSIAWPVELLTDPRGVKCAGFLMRRAEGPRVFEFYNPVSRRKTAPLFDFVAQAHDPRDAEQQLADFLAGPRVTARSDDDLTLVLVARDHA